MITIQFGRLCAATLLTVVALASSFTSATAEAVSSSLRIKVSGQIAPSCRITKTDGGGAIDLADSHTGGTRSSQLRLPFSIDCNSPFTLAMASMNGGLSFTEPTRAAAGFRTAIAYSASVDLPDGLSAGGECDSEAMVRRACEREVQANDGALGDGHITLTVRSDPQPLLKGVYADTLTLVARPRLGGDETL